MVVAEILNGRASLEKLRVDWDRLMGNGTFEPSVSYEWVSSLMEAHAMDEDEIISVILRRNNVVIGIVPLALRKVKRFGQNFVTACPISEWSNTHSDLLVEEVSEPVLGALIDALYQPHLGWDVFRMSRLLDLCPLGGFLCLLLQQRRRRFEYVREQPSFFLRLDCSYEEYLRRRSGSFRNALKRIERKLASRGTVELRHQDDFQDVEQAYEAMLSIEKRSWKQTHGTSISSVARQATFYRHLCRSAVQRKWLHLEFLCLDGQPIAYNLGLILKDTYFYLKTSYDHAERPASPSTVLRARLIEELIGRRVFQMDFPAEPYEWERQWTDEVRWHHSLTLFAPTMKGYASYLYRKTQQLRRNPDMPQVQYMNPRDLRPGRS